MRNIKFKLKNVKKQTILLSNVLQDSVTIKSSKKILSIQQINNATSLNYLCHVTAHNSVINGCV